MAVTTYKFPTSTANESFPYGVTWTNHSYIKVDDTNFATCGASTKDIVGTESLVGSAFGFSSSDIPTDSTIDGIEVVINKKITYSGTLGTGRIYDYSLYLRNGTNNASSNYGSALSWPESVASATYGGSSDMWGSSLTYSNIVSSSFSVALQAYIDVDTSTALTAHVNYIKVRVYYTAASTSSIKTIDNLSKSSVKTVNNLAIANVGSYNNLE
jgi:hypothetical protein